MPRHIKRVFSFEAVLVGCVFCTVIAIIFGVGAGLLLQSFGFGLFIGGVMWLFSIEMIFRGSDL